MEPRDRETPRRGAAARASRSSRSSTGCPPTPTSSPPATTVCTSPGTTRATCAGTRSSRSGTPAARSSRTGRPTRRATTRFCRKLKFLDGAVEALEADRIEDQRAELDARFALQGAELERLFAMLEKTFQLSKADA